MTTMTEEQARGLLGDFIVETPRHHGLPVNSLDCDGMPYLLWAPHSESATLDGEFTADQLEAISRWMRHHRKENPCQTK